ncbi:ABC-2 family transporter permease [Corynebacterium sp. CQ3829_602738]
MKSGNAWRLVCALLALVVGVFLPMNPAETWTNAGRDAEVSGAPQVGPDNLGDARRAAGEAGQQAKVLKEGAGQLAAGIGEAQGQTQQLIDALAAAQSGSQQLADGMVELQAGTGQLGAGATQLADSIGEVVGQVSGFEAVRGQVVGAIDRSLEELKGAKDPEAVKARESLKDLRAQAETAQLPPDVVAKMNQLRDGSRDLANQLAVPGYGYHDGIYTATNGSAELAAGLRELQTQTGQATGGIDELVAGVEKINQMAGMNADKVGAVRAALPVPAVAPGAAGAEPVGPTLAPVAAMLLAAMAVLGGTALAAAWFASRGRWWILGVGSVVLAAAGTILAGVIGSGFGVQEYGVAFIGLLLGTLASAGLASVLSRAFGAGVGLGSAGVLALVQAGLVGWVWRTATTAQVDSVWVALSQAAPMHWASTAVSAAGNGGDYRGIVSAVLLSAMVAAAGLAGARGRR